jgi:hypothetical protein
LHANMCRHQRGWCPCSTNRSRRGRAFLLDRVDVAFASSISDPPNSSVSTDPKERPRWWFRRGSSVEAEGIAKRSGGMIWWQRRDGGEREEVYGRRCSQGRRKGQGGRWW